MKFANIFHISWICSKIWLELKMLDQTPEKANEKKRRQSPRIKERRVEGASLVKSKVRFDMPKHRKRVKRIIEYSM